MLSFYIATTKQLQRRLPLHNALLQSASCLHPVAWTKSNNSVDMVETLAKGLSLR